MVSRYKSSNRYILKVVQEEISDLESSYRSLEDNIVIRITTAELTELYKFRDELVAKIAHNNLVRKLEDSGVEI